MALPTEIKPNTSELLPFNEYDWVVVSFSGGKDSIACILHLLERGLPKEKIELWHQSVDGEPGKDPRFFDWPCTESYCAAVAWALGLRLRFQWRVGGMEGEILKDDQPTAPSRYELPDGSIGQSGGEGKPATRLAFPDPVANLRYRWCSALLKIDVADSAIRKDPRFKSAKLLYITGERRQESNNRARYAEIERHRTETRTRRVDHWRPILDWPEQDVWAIMEKWRIRPHPGYYLGWGRLSCLPCIFGNEDQWATIRELKPKLFRKILGYEGQFGRTISMAKLDIEQQANMGRSFLPNDAFMIDLALSEDYPKEHAIVSRWRKWELPLGAYKKTGGPT